MIRLVNSQLTRPESRVRKHLKSIPGKGEPENPGQLRRDVISLLNRFKRVEARGGAFQGVELSPQMRETVKALKVVASEMLLLTPERRGA